MRTKSSFYLGIDIGSVSVKLSLVSRDKKIVEDHYQRHKGQPIQTLMGILERVLYQESSRHILRPKNPRFYIDKEYVLYAAGLLAQTEPEAA